MGFMSAFLRANYYYYVDVPPVSVPDAILRLVRVWSLWDMWAINNQLGFVSGSDGIKTIFYEKFINGICRSAQWRNGSVSLSG
jgi:hypothetical protein